MRHAFTLPKLGLTMTEGIVSEWLKQPGDAFRARECLYVVENDKVANEIEAEADGILTDITVPAGETAPVGGVIGYWEGAGDDVDKLGEPDAEHACISLVAVSDDVNSDCSESIGKAGQPVGAGIGDVGGAHRIIATPYARKLAARYDVSLAAVQGSGPNGRVVARDVEAASSDAEGSGDAVAGVPSEDAFPKDVLTSGAVPSLLPGQVLMTPTPAQRVVARRLVASKREIPHFYLALDIDVTRLVALRAEINSAQGERRLTINHFIVMAVARALGQMPEANRVWTDDGILSYEQIDVGVAVSTDDGLLAPAVCDVGELPMGILAQRLDSLVERTRAGRMNQRDLGRAAITVSNAGMHRVRYMSSIINPGQAMILGVGSVQPVFLPDADGQPELRQQMGVVLSADHRVIDGVRGLRFLNLVRNLLEQPVHLLVL